MSIQKSDLGIHEYLVPQNKKTIDNPEKNKDSIPLSNNETKKNLELLKIQRMDKLFDKLLDDEINATSYEQYKKDSKELFTLLNSYDDLTEAIVIRKCTKEELLNDIQIIQIRLIIVLSIRFLLEQLHPEYKWDNILELTDDFELDNDYSTLLEDEFNNMCITNNKNPQEELEKANVKKNPDEEELFKIINLFSSKYFPKKTS